MSEATHLNQLRKIGTIWTFDLNDPIPLLPAKIAIDFRRAGSDLSQALAEELHGVMVSEILERFKSGRRCYTAWVGAQLAACGWVSFLDEYVGELDVRLRLLPGEAYIWDCVTRPAMRGQHVYTSLLGFILARLQLDGLHRAWIGADIENVASQSGIHLAGFQPVADMVVRTDTRSARLQVQGRADAPKALVAAAHRLYLGDRDRVLLRT